MKGKSKTGRREARKKAVKGAAIRVSQQQEQQLERPRLVWYRFLINQSINPLSSSFSRILSPKSKSSRSRKRGTSRRCKPKSGQRKQVSMFLIDSTTPKRNELKCNAYLEYGPGHQLLIALPGCQPSPPSHLNWIKKPQRRANTLQSDFELFLQRAGKRESEHLKLGEMSRRRWHMLSTWFGPGKESVNRAQLRLFLNK